MTLASWCVKKNFDRAERKLNNFFCGVRSCGTRGLMKNARGTARTKNIPAIIRIVDRNPTLLRSASRIGGIPAPPAPAALANMPKAMPLRLSNHWFINTTQGQNAKHPAVPKSAPWTPMSCEMVVQKEVVRRERKQTKRPMGEKKRAQRG